jgi:hypothetical protein
MTDWDRAAHARLQGIVPQLNAAGVIPFLERTVAHVWRTNTDRYEPTEIGDTTRSLGITAAENIRELAMRARWGPITGQADLEDDVHVTASDGSLLIQCDGTTLRAIKAPSRVTLETPLWQAFDWNTESDVRLSAARNNHACYNPLGVGGGTLFDDVFPAQGDAGLLRDVFLVWAGGWSSPYTAGWLGLPTLHPDGPWLAIEPLWWHDGGSLSAAEGGTKDPDPTHDTFERRAAPNPKVVLKAKPRRSTQ